MNKQGFQKGVVLLLLVLWVTMWSAPAQAADEDVGYYIAGGACSLVYTPVKAAFFIIMGIASGFSLLGTVPASRVDVTEKMYMYGLYGTWFVQPKHFRKSYFPLLVGLERQFD